jgi:hypothetical protein
MDLAMLRSTSVNIPCERIKTNERSTNKHERPDKLKVQCNVFNMILLSLKKRGPVRHATKHVQARSIISDQNFMQTCEFQENESHVNEVRKHLSKARK